MEREFDRYVVIKNTHAKEALTEDEYKELYRLGMKCAAWRKQNGKIPFKCVVVEHDWPEYEAVWAMLEDRLEEEVQEKYMIGWEAAKHHCEHYEGYPLVRGIDHWSRGWNDYMNFRIKEEKDIINES